MITKIKSLSKRTLSVLLVLLMVISTVTVGIITTTAAYTDEDEAVGYDGPIIYFQSGSGSQSFTLGTDFTLNVPSGGYNGNDVPMYIKDDTDEDDINDFTSIPKYNYYIVTNPIDDYAFNSMNAPFNLNEIVINGK